MNVKIFFPVICLVCLLVVSCGQAAPVQQTPEPITLHVVQLPYLSFAPFYIADKAGFFAEQGIKVEYIEMQGSSEAVAPLLEGDLDVVAGTIRISLLNAMSKGGDIRFVADKGNISPDNCRYTTMMVRPDLLADGKTIGAEQMKGMRVAITEASWTAFKLETILKMEGLTLDDVEIVDVPTNLIGEALEKGTIDAADVNEPWVTRILASGQGVVWPVYEEVLKEYQSAVIIYGPTLLKDNPEAGRRFMVAFLKAVRQYNQGKTDQNVQWLAEFTGQEADILKQMCWPGIRNDGQIYLQSILKFQDWAVEKGYLDNKAAESQIWDSSFIDYANEVLGAPQ